jgi:hypothetical protein
MVMLVQSLDGQITIGKDIDGHAAGANHGIRVNDTVIIAKLKVQLKH